MATQRSFRVKLFGVLKRSIPKFASASTVVAVTLIVISYNACTKSNSLVPLTPVSLQSVSTQSVQLNFCTPPAQAQQNYVKTLIIFDHSGSNAENYQMAADGSGAPQLTNGNIAILPSLATDPTGITRYGTPTTPGTLLNYLNTIPANDPANPTQFFGLIDFSSSAYYPSPGGNSSTNPGFTSNIANFYQTVLKDSGQNVMPSAGPSDSGGTSYLSALAAANQMINGDIQAAKACAALAKTATPTASCPHPGVITPSAYMIIFMSDGSPIINITPQVTNGVTTGFAVNKESSSDILANVESLIALDDQSQYVVSVNLFTIYYYFPGNVDTSGQQLLAQMAKTGNGLAYNALSGSNINYAQFQPPAELVQYTLSDLFVTNASGVWWNGQFLLDSDGDGLPDLIEKQWGSNPAKAHTFTNGLSDLVNYQLKNGLCTSKNASTGICNDTMTDYHAGSGVCSSLSITTSGGFITYPSSDPDGMNDCEKMVLNDAAGVNVPDSNADQIPDYLEFVNGVPFQTGTTSAQSLPEQDGYSVYNKVKYDLPVNVPLNTAINLSPSNYQVNLVSTSVSQSCYNVVVTNLPMLTQTDKIRVDLVLKSSLANDSYMYKLGFKNFTSGKNQLIINDWTNTAEITSKTWSSWP